MTPPLTTVSFDAARIGELGARLLLKAIGATAGDRQPEVLTVKPKLVVRGSTGAPGGRDTQPNGSGTNGTNGKKKK
jgi:DNA-binding LacI/PurR family transcriptional regulator